MLSIRPLNAKVIVRLVDPPGRAGLLFLPETARGRTQRGVVVSAGPGRTYPSTGQVVPPGVRPGDVVVFTAYADVPVHDSRAPSAQPGFTDGDDRLVAVSQEEILCVLDACCAYPQYPPGQAGAAEDSLRFAAEAAVGPCQNCGAMAVLLSDGRVKFEREDRQCSA